jgi:glutamate N-acetyltransferase/amino-acid N-acetyltransferase
LNLPLGYAYAATYAGIRQVEKDDLALIVTGAAAAAAAVFTQNRVQAAPVKLCRRHLKLSRGLVGAILVNAGNANCATRTGDAVALATSKAAAKLLKLPVSQVLPASTGVIGVELDPRRIIDALPRLVSGLATGRFDDAARAIMTTDLVPKTAFAETRLRRGVVRTAGMTKGSGMIQPRMATTLGFVMTDASIPAGAIARHAEARRGAQLQPPVGGRGHFHQRHPGAAGQRRIRSAPGPPRASPCGRGDRTRDGVAGAGHRARRRRRAEVHHHRGFRNFQ